MRLGSKIFLTSALVIVVLAGVGFLSLRALGRLVSVNREIATRTVPALRLTASAREAIAPLVRLEARAIVLGDARYATAWTERAARVADNLDRLAEYAVSEREAFYLREASAAFEGYRRVVAEEQALLQRGERARALRLTDADARVLTEDVQENLDGLMAATHTRVLAAQAEAARLESRPRTAHGEAGTPHGHHRAELRAAAPARQSDPRDVAPAGGARGARPQAAQSGVARGPRRRGDPPAGRGGGHHPRARAPRSGLYVSRRRGAPPPAGRQPRRQRDPLHPARGARRRATDRHRPGARAPGRGHGRRHPRRCVAAHLRGLPPGPQRAGRHGPGPRDRARHRGRPRRAGDRRGARRKKEPLHRAPAARLRISVVAPLLPLLARGCASLPPWPWWYGPELVKADRLVEQGDYAGAVAAYDACLPRHGADARVRMSRNTVASILALQREIARLREDLAKREADLERLKELDLRIERRGEKK